MQKILIIDLGGQYTHLIARRIRNLGIFSEITNPEDIEFSDEVVGLILSGGPQSVNAEDSVKLDLDMGSLKIPVLGICYGHQLLIYMLGGKVESGTNKEYGFTRVGVESDSILFAGLEPDQQVWMSHGDHVGSLPEGFRITASSYNIEVAAFESDDGRFFGVQFHPEVTHTACGIKMLDNFLKCCSEIRDWKASNYAQKLIENVKLESGRKKLVLLLSGGVDSLVALELCVRAVGAEQVFSIHVDTGFMRKNESSKIMAHFRKLGYGNLKVIEAETSFLDALSGVIDPERKRLIIGRLFVEILHKELQDRIDSQQDWMLVQGTIYPDTIESGSSSRSAKIKTHHNRVEEIEDLIRQGRIIEPIKELYKDEVRELGRELDLPQELVSRQPFPGPGLAIRLIASDGSIDDDHRQESRELDDILSNVGLKGFILPVKSVGVQGDFRTYHHPAVIWSEGFEGLSWEKLRSTVSLIVNRLATVNRVCFSCLPLRSEPVLKKHLINRENMDQLREVDAFFRKNTNHLKDIWQLPVVSLPLFDEKGPVYVIRPVRSKDAMTADFFEMDFDLLYRIVNESVKVLGTGRIYYDITSKPPGTIEWE